VVARRICRRHRKAAIGAAEDMAMHPDCADAGGGEGASVLRSARVIRAHWFTVARDFNSLPGGVSPPVGALEHIDGTGKSVADENLAWVVGRRGCQASAGSDKPRSRLLRGAATRFHDVAAALEQVFAEPG